MNIADYLIDQRGHDWAELLAGWGSELPPGFTLWMVNRLGDLIMVMSDGSVFLLDVGAGSIRRLADSRDHFITLIAQVNHADEWLAIPLVDACVAAGMQLGPNQCYGFNVPPMLGGEYSVDNMEPTDLVVHYGILADVHRQTKDFPDGTPIRVVKGE